MSAMVVARATARPVCDALAAAMRAHGVPEAILTDNGKVFTGRFGPGSGEVLFDRICRENGIRHLLTAPHSPTTTGKVERFHKTLKGEFLAGKVFESIDAAQAAVVAVSRAAVAGRHSCNVGLQLQLHVGAFFSAVGHHHQDVPRPRRTLMPQWTRRRMSAQTLRCR